MENTVILFLIPAVIVLLVMWIAIAVIRELKQSERGYDYFAEYHVFGATEFCIPPAENHSKWKCLRGDHWLTVVRTVENQIPVGVICGLCEKPFRLHDTHKADHPMGKVKP